MEIKNFTGTIRVGGNFPTCVDVSPAIKDRHETYGIVASAFTYRNEKESGFVQVRLDRKNGQVHTVCLTYGDLEKHLPDYIRESEIIYDSRNA